MRRGIVKTLRLGALGEVIPQKGNKCQCKEKVDIKTTDKIQLNETEQQTESKPGKFEKYGTSA